MFDWLTFITLFPIVGVIILFFIPKNNGAVLKNIALIVSIVNFLFSLVLLVGFQSNSSMQFEVNKVWIKNLGINYHIGIDGISIFIVLLTTFLTPIVILSAYNVLKDPKFQDKAKEYMSLLLILETAVIGALISLDLILFYLFWEMMLIPMYFLIGIFGGDKKTYAALKFFIYTVAGSIMMLVAMFVLYVKSGATSFDLAYIISHVSLTTNEQGLLFLAFFIAFAVKVPMFPLHTWLPDAHVQAPTGGSVILAGVLLKMGTYGFIRFAVPLFPEVAVTYAGVIGVFAVIGIGYGALVAMVQKDVKKLVAYSSISHLGFVVLGIFAFTNMSVTGAIYQMLNHGISTGALFLLVGIIYERRHTKEIKEFGGLTKVMPLYAVIFLIATLSSIALPLTNGFVGEFLILSGTYTSRFMNNSSLLTILATSGVVLGAGYMLWMFKRVMFGPLTNEKNKNLKDLSLREFTYLFPLVVMVFVMGIFPNFFLSRIEPSVNSFLEKNIHTRAFPKNNKKLALKIKNEKRSKR
jgi:NADH-quinone oxidoreductase subunit M